MLTFSARDLWKKRYFDEKKKTGPLEEQTNRLRHELDIIHKKLLATLEGPKEKATKLNDLKPSSKVGSPGRPLVSPSFQTSRSQSPMPMNSPIQDREYESERQTWQDSDITSPGDSGSPVQRQPYPAMNRSNSPTGRILQNMPAHYNNNSYRSNAPNVYLSPRYQESRTSGAMSNNSPRTFKPPKMTGNQLNQFQSEYMKKKQEKRKQYPVALIGSDQKALYFENEQFDLDYDSPQSSERSNVVLNNSGSLSSKKNVKFR